jgi:S1-C subfamily serine protease
MHDHDAIVIPAKAGIQRLVSSMRGEAGAPIPLTLSRDGKLTNVTVESVDRNALLKKPRLQ